MDSREEILIRTRAYTEAMQPGEDLATSHVLGNVAVADSFIKDAEEQKLESE